MRPSKLAFEILLRVQESTLFIQVSGEKFLTEKGMACREPEWGIIEIIKLILMGLLWGAFVLGTIHFSKWLGAWWDNNIGTPGRPGWKGFGAFIGR